MKLQEMLTFEFTDRNGNPMRVGVQPESIQNLRFSDGDLFMVYTQGDCDVFSPYVTL